jgi:4-amino-4-deoxy-L-arabinose transferase-like glycosyltransferase
MLSVAARPTSGSGALAPQQEAGALPMAPDSEKAAYGAPQRPSPAGLSGKPSSGPSDDGGGPRLSRLRRWVPLVGGIAALVAGWQGERRIEAGDPSWLGFGLLLSGILVFVASAWPMAPGPADVPAPPAPAGAADRRGFRVGLWIGSVIAGLLGLAALWEIRQHWGSQSGVWLWAASVAAIGLTGIAFGRRPAWAERWGGGVWPTTRGGWLRLTALVVLLLGLAAADRLIWLDRVPPGIYPDEGDQAALSIQIVLGKSDLWIFDYGWYFISMVYFWILALTMKLAGIGLVGARMLNAVLGIVTVAVVMWMGIRHFGTRVGLVAGGILAVLGAALQFSREITCAGPTATLWTLSAAAFLEAARRGRARAWILAGLAGGFSLYFYPTGRMWAAVAVLFCAYLFLHGLGGRRGGILRGTALAALAALLISAPFLYRASFNQWETIYLRAREVSIFVPGNPMRLGYYRREWTMGQLLEAQLERSLGIFNRYPDMNSVFPTGRPLMPGLLALLTFTGLGWVCLRPRDPRCVLLAIWFWVGFIGVVVTVETPNLHRMSAAIPVLGLLPALVLDSLARRVEEFFLARRPASRFAVRWAIASTLAVSVAWLMTGQWKDYFVDYASMNPWAAPTLMAERVRDQGENTLVMTLARQNHIINQGWIRVLAHNTPRAGVPFPGHDLPLPISADKNLAFMLLPEQPQYVPYVMGLYPGGRLQRTSYRGQYLFSIYRLSKQQWQALQGALAHPPQGAPVHVSRLGEAPAPWSAYPSPMRWTAAWRVPQYSNYALQAGPGPATLTIDGVKVLDVPEGQPDATATLSLAQGDHFIDYAGFLTAQGQPATFKWAPVSGAAGDQTAPPPEWRPANPAALRPVDGGPDGLFVVLQPEGRPEIHRIDGTLASGGISSEIRFPRYTATWTGTMTAPRIGGYVFSLFAQGSIEFLLDGQALLRRPEPSDQPTEISTTLQAGPHSVQLVLRATEGPGGLEWSWTPPGGTKSIVPRWVLSPPPGAGIGPPVPLETLGAPDLRPTDDPLYLVP